MDSYYNKFNTIINFMKNDDFATVYEEAIRSGANQKIIDWLKKFSI